jgi:hypothetical protein
MTQCTCLNELGLKNTPVLIIIIIIYDTYKALPRTHAVKALLPIHFSKKPSFQLPLEGLIVLKWHEMLWQLVPQSCCTNRKTHVTISTSGSVDITPLSPLAMFYKTNYKDDISNRIHLTKY